MRTHPRTELERLNDQLVLGQYRRGPDAVRSIAQRIEGEHGFWDFEARKRASVLEVPSISVVPDVRTLVSAGQLQLSDGDQWKVL